MTPAQLFSLAGRRAIVTGSTRGIGKAIAGLFVQAGAKVAISSESEEDTVSAAKELGQIGIAADVTDEAAIENLVDYAVKQLGGLDILVCNAGITGAPGPLTNMDMADYDRVMSLNLRGHVRLCQLAMPHLKASPSARIILLSSISALRGNAAINAYALSKAGMSQLARNLAVECGPSNVCVNAIAPGFIRTELSAPLLNNAEFMKKRMQMTPLRRPGEVEEIAATALYLASDAGGFVTGQTLVVDGGTTITDGN